MSVSTSKLQILIDAKNQAGQVLRGVQSDVQGLGRSLSFINPAFAALGTATALAGLTKFGMGLATASATSLDVERSFNSLADSVGTSSSRIIESLREASKGTIDTTSLQLAASKAMSLGVSNDATVLSDLMKIAADRAKRFGISTGEAFERITLGAGKMRNQLLDEIGIIVDTEQAFENYAKALGKTTNEMSVAERQQAFLNAILESGAGAIENFAPDRSKAEDIQAFSAAVSNLADSAGRMILARSTDLGDAMGMGGGTGLSGIINNIADELDDATMLENAHEGLVKLQADLLETAHNGNLLEKAIDNVRLEGLIPGTGVNNQLAVTQALLLELKAASEEAATGEETAAQSAEQLQGSLVGVRPAAYEAGDSLNYLADLAWSTGGAIDSLSAKLAGLSGRFGAIDQAKAAAVGQAQSAIELAFSQGLVGIDEAAAAMATVDDQINSVYMDAGATVDEFYRGKLELLGMGQAAAEPYKELVKTSQEMQRLGSSTAGVKSEFNALTSKVAGLLAEMQTDSAGVDADDLLPDPVRLDENARRLADIAVNGFKGQDWMDQFAAEVPDIYEQLKAAADPQAAAAQLLDDFQDGFLNGTDVLVNKEAAKARVKRMILGEQGAAALAEEIAQEISQEMGISLGQARQAAQGALGGGGTASAGAAPLKVVPVISGADIPPISVAIAPINWDDVTIPCIPVEICEDKLTESLAALKDLTVQVWPVLPAESAEAIRSALSTQMGAGSQVMLPVYPQIADGVGWGLMEQIKSQIYAQPVFDISSQIVVDNSAASIAQGMIASGEENADALRAVGIGLGMYVSEGLAGNFDAYLTVQSISNGMVSEFGGSNLGGEMALAFAKQVDSAASTWEAGGRRGADYAIAGFANRVMGSNLDDVWISKLAGEVAPIVAAQLNGEAMATNAARDDSGTDTSGIPRGDAPSGYKFPRNDANSFINSINGGG